MIKDSKKILVLDFDGVVCDSTSECLVTSLDAWQIYSKDNIEERFVVDINDEEFVKFFRRLRPYVRGGGEYLIVYLFWVDGKILPSRKDFVFKSNSLIKEQDTFAKIFYECRSNLIVNNETMWCSLHVPVNDVLEIIYYIFIYS